MDQPAPPQPALSQAAERSAGAELVLGPMLRYVGETEATVWVETDRDCQVEILGRRAATFEVAGHHYGLVVIDGLPPGSETEYQVALDGVVRWPPAGGDFPPSVLRTLGTDRRDGVRLAFGSCRAAEIAPRNLGKRAARDRAAAGAFLKGYQGYAKSAKAPESLLKLAMSLKSTLTSCLVAPGQRRSGRLRISFTQAGERL